MSVPTPEPRHVDKHVGERVRRQRKTLGVSQTALADQLGLTFQQVQKYERGFNRVSASRLWDIADALGVPIPYFFEGLTPAAGHREPTTAERVLTPWSRELATLTDHLAALPFAARRPAIDACVAVARAGRKIARAGGVIEADQAEDADRALNA
jgi:transcriptional regulator with XRE-family HTH domain